jgi:hypothetical protein
LKFDLVESLPTPAETFDDRFEFDSSWQRARMLSVRYGTGIYLDLDDGSIGYLDPERMADTCFVNSSVEMLGYFLAEWNIPWEPEVGRPDPAWRRAKFDELVRRMREADPEGLDPESGTFWSLVVEDAGYFL